ncbi:abortive infection system antitoxin AbiGi family protein [Alkalihalobacillus sp. AL-G]|uniref:abortive infection system antitoxin AbiGi family protein n=1 Tax=Alkalihalobacillus sp. AL-G TaxID=2926399 RepID=UPI00272D5F6B|nr:abortive infection system antitoxin AbiGi family protein [Alkalihalobacillus sp. AL-G]WLD93958.1 abortive infection system antitoxin AbiGi family protein [Alkalihalobacillus sp. AL-G]
MQRYYSRIYWHFTGSPTGSFTGLLTPDELLQKSQPKSDDESVALVESIIESQILKATGEDQVGSYKTNAFCCTTDIPFKDLLNHSVYYGRAAIGFKANVIHDLFIPVLYLSAEHSERDQYLNGDHPINDFIKLTDFQPKKGHTFYREREWRHIGDFRFKKEDIAAIVVPDHFLKSIRGVLDYHHYPEDISVLSWRLIEEA